MIGELVDNIGYKYKYIIYIMIPHLSKKVSKYVQ